MQENSIAIGMFVVQCLSNVRRTTIETVHKKEFTDPGLLGHLPRDDLINPVKMSVRPYVGYVCTYVQMSVRPYVHNQTQCSHKPNSEIC